MILLTRFSDTEVTKRFYVWAERERSLAILRSTILHPSTGYVSPAQIGLISKHILTCQVIVKNLSWWIRWNSFSKMILKSIVWKFITFLWSICPQTLVHASMYRFSVFISIWQKIKVNR